MTENLSKFNDMRVIPIVLSLVLSASAFSQETRNLIKFEYKFIKDLWKPFSEQGAIYNDSNGTISSSSKSMNLHTTIISKPKWNVNVGLAFKKINFKIEDRIHYWNYTRSVVSVGQLYTDTNYRVFNDPADFNATSTSVGVLIEVNYEVFRTDVLIGNAGIDLEIYGYEKYIAWYSSDDFTVNDYPESIPKAGSGPRRKFFLSSANASVYYRTIFYPNEYYDLGLKLSLGGNIHSDWSQFKKYIWLGIGLEISLNKGWKSR